MITDPEWTGWLPILSWLIDHPEGPMVVDTGETARAGHPGYFPGWHPYYRRAVEMDVAPEEEVGPRLLELGVDPLEVRRVILTHLHTDHAGGLRHFPKAQIHVSGTEYHQARGLMGRLRGYLPHRWPPWFQPTLIPEAGETLGGFSGAIPLTEARDVWVVPTPGHTPGHQSVIVQTGGMDLFLAGDTSYSQELLLEQVSDGVSPKAAETRETMARILEHAAERPTVYLPSHDPGSVDRLRSEAVIPSRVPVMAVA